MTGYSFDHNVSDIEAVVSKLGLKKFCLMAWSIGVTYSIAYAFRHPDLVAGLVLLDYQAHYPKLGVGWAERVSSDPSIGKDPNRMRGLRGLELESSEVVLWNSLDRIKCPVLVIGGGQPGALLKPEHIQKYRQHLPGAEIVVFEDSGHNVSQPNHDRFIATLKSFLNRLDGI
jgi:pimeloyl-ACP methyl ester carboxylesterase